MKTSYIVIGIVVAVVAIGGIFVLQSNNKSQAPSLGEEENMVPPLGEQPQLSRAVAYSDEGYSPKEITVQKGEIVMFKNESSQLMWAASAIHPSHTVYPGTDIRNCGSAMMDTMFDACTGVPTGETWKFQFNEVGSWGYHNHLRPTHTGKIIVE